MNHAVSFINTVVSSKTATVPLEKGKPDPTSKDEFEGHISTSPSNPAPRNIAAIRKGPARNPTVGVAPWKSLVRDTKSPKKSARSKSKAAAEDDESRTTTRPERGAKKELSKRQGIGAQVTNLDLKLKAVEGSFGRRMDGFMRAREDDKVKLWDELLKVEEEGMDRIDELVRAREEDSEKTRELESALKKALVENEEEKRKYNRLREKFENDCRQNQFTLDTQSREYSLEEILEVRARPFASRLCIEDVKNDQNVVRLQTHFSDRHRTRSFPQRFCDYTRVMNLTKTNVGARNNLGHLMTELFEMKAATFHSLATTFASALSDNGRGVTFEQELYGQENPNKTPDPLEQSVLRLQFSRLLHILFSKVKLERQLRKKGKSNIFRLAYCSIKYPHATGEDNTTESTMSAYFQALVAFAIQAMLTLYIVLEGADRMSDRPHHKVYSRMVPLASLILILSFFISWRELSGTADTLNFYKGNKVHAGQIHPLALLDYISNLILPVFLMIGGFVVILTQERYIEAVMNSAALLFTLKIHDILPAVFKLDTKKIVQNHLIGEAVVELKDYQKCRKDTNSECNGSECFESILHAGEARVDCKDDQGIVEYELNARENSVATSVEPLENTRAYEITTKTHVKGSMDAYAIPKIEFADMLLTNYSEDENHITDNVVCAPHKILGTHEEPEFIASNYITRNCLFKSVEWSYTTGDSFSGAPSIAFLKLQKLDGDDAPYVITMKSRKSSTNKCNHPEDEKDFDKDDMKSNITVKDNNAIYSRPVVSFFDDSDDSDDSVTEQSEESHSTSQADSVSQLEEPHFTSRADLSSQLEEPQCESQVEPIIHKTTSITQENAAPDAHEGLQPSDEIASQLYDDSRVDSVCDDEDIIVQKVDECNDVSISCQSSVVTDPVAIDTESIHPTTAAEDPKTDLMRDDDVIQKVNECNDASISGRSSVTIDPETIDPVIVAEVLKANITRDDVLQKMNECNDASISSQSSVAIDPVAIDLETIKPVTVLSQQLVSDLCCNEIVPPSTIVHPHQPLDDINLNEFLGEHADADRESIIKKMDECNPVYKVEGVYMITNLECTESITKLRICGSKNAENFTKAVETYSLWELDGNAKGLLHQNSSKRNIATIE